MVDLTGGQLEKLADLTMDIAKGLFLAGLLIPVLSSIVTIFESVRSIVLGVFFVNLSLKFLRLKEGV